MKWIYIGEFIRKKRESLGLSQSQLCAGICESITLSRFERGKQRLSRDKTVALLERLGLPGEYAYYLTPREIEIENLQREIISCSISENKSDGLKKLELLKSIITDDDKRIKQFILRSSILLGKPEGDYTFYEKRQILLDAIHLTSPQFSISSIPRGIYTIEEIKVINHLGKIYSENGNIKTAVDIYTQLFHYITTHFENIGQFGGCFPMVSYNLALGLSKINCYTESLEIATLARQACIDYGHYQYLAGSTVIMAKCYHFLGDDEKSKIFYHRTYTLYLTLGDERNAQNAKDSAMEYLGEDLTY